MRYRRHGNVNHKQPIDLKINYGVLPVEPEARKNEQRRNYRNKKRAKRGKMKPPFDGKKNADRKQRHEKQRSRKARPGTPRLAKRCERHDKKNMKQERPGENPARQKETARPASPNGPHIEERRREIQAERRCGENVKCHH
jgi:hypothetical protein